MNKIAIELFKPRYEIGQKIYIPEKNKVVETEILEYEVKVGKEGSNLLGVVSDYKIVEFVFVRRGEEQEMVGEVKERDFYTDEGKAKEASRFLEVMIDEETWKLAIGDRDDKDENSPYNINNCDLSICCANISEARNILIYCWKEDGLIVHERDYLRDLIKSHSFEGGEPTKKIFEQLGID